MVLVLHVQEAALKVPLHGNICIILKPLPTTGAAPAPEVRWHALPIFTEGFSNDALLLPYHQVCLTGIPFITIQGLVEVYDLKKRISSGNHLSLQFNNS